MNNLRTKLFLQVASMICAVFLLSFLINLFFLPAYFLHKKKLVLENLAIQLETMDEHTLIQNVDSLENEYNLMIAYVEIDENIDDLNWNLRENFRKKGLALSKFWISAESLEILQDNQIVNKLYDQGKMKSSFLVMFVRKGNLLFSFGDSIAYSGEIIRIVNEFQFYVFLGALVLTIFISRIFTKKIVLPLEELQKTAKNISNLTYTQANIKTGDEIEALADSINTMSNNLQKAHQELDEKNKNLRIFISDISHELKTPLTLIKAYSTGLIDGFDDGTFCSTIQKQVDDISNLVDRLLALSKLQAEFYTRSPFHFQEMCIEVLAKYAIAFQEKTIHVFLDDSQLVQPYVFADKTKIDMVLNNFISNAIKYTTNQQIELILKNEENMLLFSIRNGIDAYDELQLSKIWEPFYVMESSRSKKISGTGLGLSIVKTILEKHESSFGYHVYDGQIEFYFLLPTASVR